MMQKFGCFPHSSNRSNILTSLKLSNFKCTLGYLLTSFLLLMIVFSPVSTFAESLEKHEYLDFQQYTGNRLLVFNDTQIDYCITKTMHNQNFFYIAYDAIQTWHERITEVTKNPNVWNMTLHVFPKDDSFCDGYINYQKIPDLTSFQIYGVVGFSHPASPIANVTIYTDNYQKTLFKMSEEDNSFWDDMTIEKFTNIIENQEHEQLDSQTIKRITLHEIGHSLSLNHPSSQNGNLYEQPGIMGYNMTYFNIDDDEVIEIVKSYPNGFVEIPNYESIRLDSNTKKTLNLGETINLTIEIPHRSGKTAPTGIEVYFFPEGTSFQKPFLAPVKILHSNDGVQIENDGKYIQDINSILATWGSTKVLSMQFKTIAPFSTADMIIISHRIGGFEEQWFLKDVLSTKTAEFSDFLLKFEETKETFYLKGSNPNRIIEKEVAFETKQEESHREALVQCLSKDNMKTCMNELPEY